MQQYNDIPSGAEVIGYSDLPPGAEVLHDPVEDFKGRISQAIQSVPRPSVPVSKNYLIGGAEDENPSFKSRVANRIEGSLNQFPQEVIRHAPEMINEIVSSANTPDTESSLTRSLQAFTAGPRALYEQGKQMYSDYSKDPANLVGDIVSGIVLHGATSTPGTTARPVTTAPPVDLAQVLTSALKKSNKVNVYETAQRAIPAIQEAADLKGVSAEHFQGQRGIQLSKEVIDHAIDVHESRFAQALGPVADGRINLVDLAKESPELAREFTSEKNPYINKNTGNSYVTMREINNARTEANNTLRAKGTFLLEPTKAAVMQNQAKAVAAQAKSILYKEIKGVTGVDVGPLKQTESALLKLKDVMDATAKDISKKEADFAANPFQNKKPSYGLSDIPITKSRILNFAEKYQARQQPPPSSPAELFNQRIRQVLQK